jgi:inhibitor of KinA
MHQLQFKLFGEKAILIEWFPEISMSVLNGILDFQSKIATNNYPFLETIIGYNSLTILYSQKIVNYENEVEILKNIYKSDFQILNKSNYFWEIPVCYDAEFGLDLKEISIKNNLSIDKIVTIHSETIYTVFFIGFLPGFLYLAGLNPQLFMDRKPNPRLKIDKGSVGIGGKQTGIYPLNSPGGWNIIGKTPLLFFDSENEIPCFATTKDQIKFIPINIKEFYEIQESVANRSYHMIKKQSND